MSAFDPDAFLASTTLTEANDTKITPCPAGDYNAIIKSIKPRPWESKDRSTSGVALDIVWKIDDEGAKQATGRVEVAVRQGIMLDVNEGGALDMGRGKNVGLGRLREALGLNVPGQPFTFGMLEGQIARVTVTHRVVDGDIFDQIKQVTKLA